MGKLNVAVCSGLSPVTPPPLGEILGVDRRTAFNLVVSGGLYSLWEVYGIRPEAFQDGEWRGAWHTIPLEAAVALRQYFGHDGQSRPWGLRRDWDHGLEGFRRGFLAQKAGGWRLEFLDGDWVWRPP